MAARYAVYLAPPAGSALWRFGSRVLGYDAATGEDLPGFRAAGCTEAAWAALTERPRIYGFHATLKAPFRLASSPLTTLPQLRRAMAAFAAGREAFDLGPLQVTAIAQGGSGFVALVQRQPSARLAELEQAAVASLDPFRAPPTPEEIARRRPDRLTPRQRENLARWGYPHVGEDYRFHMTLTGELANVDEIADALADLYAAEVGSAHMIVDALALFEQPDASLPFRIIERFPLRQPEDLRRREAEPGLEPTRGDA